MPEDPMLQTKTAQASSTERTQPDHSALATLKEGVERLEPIKDRKEIDEHTIASREEMEAKGDAVLEDILSRALRHDEEGWVRNGNPARQQKAPRDKTPSDDADDDVDDDGEGSGRQRTSPIERALKTLRRDNWLTRDLERLQATHSQEEIIALAKRREKAHAKADQEFEERGRTIASLEARLAELEGTAPRRSAEQDDEDADAWDNPDDTHAPLDQAQDRAVWEKAKALTDVLDLDGDPAVVDALVNLVRAAQPAPSQEPDWGTQATQGLLDQIIVGLARQDLGNVLPSLADDDDAFEAVLERAQVLLETGDYGANYSGAFRDAAALELGEEWFGALGRSQKTRATRRQNGSLDIQSPVQRDASEHRQLNPLERADKALEILLRRDAGDLDHQRSREAINLLFG